MEELESPSDSLNNISVIRALHHSDYNKKKATRASTFVCQCDFREVADIIVDLLNDNLVERYD